MLAFAADEDKTVENPTCIRLTGGDEVAEEVEVPEIIPILTLRFFSFEPK